MSKITLILKKAEDIAQFIWSTFGSKIVDFMSNIFKSLWQKIAELFFKLIDWIKDYSMEIWEQIGEAGVGNFIAGAFGMA